MIPKKLQPPMVVKEQVKQLSPHLCDIDSCAVDILNERIVGGRFGRWTVRDRERLHEVIHMFRASIQAIMSGADVSDDVHRAWMEARTIAPGAGYTGVKAVKEILLSWLGTVFAVIDMPEWDAK